MEKEEICKLYLPFHAIPEGSIEENSLQWIVISSWKKWSRCFLKSINVFSGQPLTTANTENNIRSNGMYANWLISITFKSLYFGYNISILTPTFM